MTKPITIKTNRGRKLEAYIDEERNLLFTQYTTTELAERAGWEWEEKEEQLKNFSNEVLASDLIAYLYSHPELDFTKCDICWSDICIAIKEWFGVYRRKEEQHGKL